MTSEALSVVVFALAAAYLYWLDRRTP